MEPSFDRMAGWRAETFETSPSVLTRLTAACAEKVPADIPCRLLWKRPKPHKRERFKREVRFYRQVAPLLNGLGLVRCIDSSTGTASRLPWLLLEDASATHAAADEPATLPSLLAIAAALAALHASVWNHVNLTAIAGMAPEAALQQDLSGNERRYAELADIFGDRLPSRWKQVYQSALDAAPALLLARAKQGSLTLCHPDSHLGNFLLPRQENAGCVLIVDWHDYKAGWGAGDIARLLLGSPERRAFEHPVLRHYHASLTAAGVTGYDWDSLRRDYRLSALHNLFVPLGNRRQPWVWNQLEQAVSAFDVLDCRELLP